MREVLICLMLVGTLPITGCTFSLGGGHVVVDVVCDPPVSVAVAYEPVVGLPEVVLYRYDFDLGQWLDENLHDAAKDLAPILEAVAASECEMEFPGERE
jgi:hypothetical protein